MIKKRVMIGLISFLATAVVLTAGILIAVFVVLPKYRDPDIKISDVVCTQVLNNQKANISWELEDTNPDKVVITIINSKNVEVYKTEISNPTQLAKRNIIVDVPYGKYKVDVETIARSKRDSKQVDLEVFTDEYVIAPLVATMPVTMFSLQLDEITNDLSIPTFVWLSRGRAWDYSKLPDNVNLIPFGSFSSMSYDSDITEMYEQTALWVKELYEMNNTSVFHFYFNDFHPQGFYLATYSIGLPVANYDVTMMSDGTASGFVFDRTYLSSDAEEKYTNELLPQYNAIKEEFQNVGIDYNKWKRTTSSTHELADYILCMLKEEPNVKLQLARRFNASANDTINAWVEDLKTATKIQNLSLGSLLNALDASQKTRLQNLYKFSDNMYEKAVAEGKGVMILLGTNTSLEYNFDGYVAATMAYYGNDYVYYYKGHPATPTMADPDKITRLENLGLIDLDSNIAAELLFFFNENAKSSGYPSSTYQSLTDAQVGGVWGLPIDSDNSGYLTYKEKVNFTIQKFDSDNTKYGQLATSDSYVFEFRDDDSKIAVFDNNTNTLKYYNVLVDGFEEVE